MAVATAKAVEFGVDTLACASTGNLAGATAAAAAAAGLRAFVFVPADLEPAKIDHALAYGATVVPIDGTYDQVNRLSMEVADELGWAFVNITLRPFYAEGSKTLAFEIAERLGWRLPDVVVGPIASGSLFTKVAKGFDELVTVGLVEPKPVKFIGGQAAGCSPVATAFAEGDDVIRPVEHPTTIVRSLAIGSPADGRYALELARRTGGSIESVDGRGDRRGHPFRGGPRGDLPGDGRRGHDRGRRAGARRRDHRPRRRGRRAPHRQRAQDTGRPVVRPRRPARRARRTRPRAGHRPEPGGIRAVARRMSTVRIPPVLRVRDRRPEAGRREWRYSRQRDRLADRRRYPGLAPQLLDERGGLNRFVNVYLNDTDVRHLQELATPVDDRDTLLLLPAMAGGAGRPSRPARVPADRA